MNLQAINDTASAGIANPYDTIWATATVPTKAPQGIERVMLAEDKLYVVLAVVLIIWIGLVLFLFRTDRKLDRLERMLQERLPETNAGASP
jgi:CcmD family protein